MSADTLRLSADAVTPRAHPGRWITAVVAVLLGSALLQSVVTNDRFRWDIVRHYVFSDIVLRGVGITLELTAICMAIGVVLGTIGALMRMSSNPVLRAISMGYVWVFRGTPTLVQLLIFYNIAALYPRLGIGLPFVEPFFSVEANTLITAMGAAIVGLGLHEGAYMSEIIRAGIQGVDRGQSEAAWALGLRKRTTLRRIVLPQATRLIIPPSANQLISLLKLTSLVSVLGIGDLLYNVERVYTRTFMPIPLLIAATLWYLAITSGLMLVQGMLERRLGRGYR